MMRIVPSRGRGDEGQVAPLVGMLLLGLLVLLGLVSDGGMVLSARRDLVNMADAAARAGASAVDEAAARDPAGERVEVDPQAAEQAARNYLSEVGFAGAAEITATAAGISVRLTEERRPLFGRLLGMASVTVRAESQAAPRGVR